MTATQRSHDPKRCRSDGFWDVGADPWQQERVEPRPADSAEECVVTLEAEGMRYLRARASDRGALGPLSDNSPKTPRCTQLDRSRKNIRR